jgi:hypothetical protein
VARLPRKNGNRDDEILVVVEAAAPGPELSEYLDACADRIRQAAQAAGTLAATASVIISRASSRLGCEPHFRRDTCGRAPGPVIGP